MSALERAPGAAQVSMMVREVSTAASWLPARAGRQPAVAASSSSPWRRARAATGRPGGDGVARETGRLKLVLKLGKSS